MEYTLKSQSKDMRHTMRVQCRTSDDRSITADEKFLSIQYAKLRRSKIVHSVHTRPTKDACKNPRLLIRSTDQTDHDGSVATHAVRIKRSRSARKAQPNPTGRRPPKCLIESICDNHGSIIRDALRTRYPSAFIWRLTEIGPTFRSPAP